MARTGGLGRLCVLILLVVACACSAAFGATAAPHNGAWSIRPYTLGGSPGQPGIKEFTGSFDVHGSAVTNLKGVTGTANHSGCTAHVKLQSVGSAVIHHYTDTSGADFYLVGKGSGNTFSETLTVKATAPGSKHAETIKAMIRIWFPGGVGDYTQGKGAGNMQVAGKAVGVVCNLNFDVR